MPKIQLKDDTKPDIALRAKFTQLFGWLFNKGFKGDDGKLDGEFSLRLENSSISLLTRNQQGVQLSANMPACLIKDPLTSSNAIYYDLGGEGENKLLTLENMDDSYGSLAAVPNLLSYNQLAKYSAIKEFNLLESMFGGGEDGPIDKYFIVCPPVLEEAGQQCVISFNVDKDSESSEALLFEFRLAIFSDTALCNDYIAVLKQAIKLHLNKEVGYKFKQVQSLNTDFTPDDVKEISVQSDGTLLKTLGTLIDVGSEELLSDTLTAVTWTPLSSSVVSVKVSFLLEVSKNEFTASGGTISTAKPALFDLPCEAVFNYNVDDKQLSLSAVTGADSGQLTRSTAVDRLMPAITSSIELLLLKEYHINARLSGTVIREKSEATQLLGSTP